MGILGVTAAAALAAAGSGNAGGGTGGSGLWVCGPHKSVAVKSPLAHSVPTKYVAGLHAAAPARPQSFYKIQLNVSGPCQVSFPDAPVAFYVPAAREVRILDSSAHALWIRLPRHLNNVLRRAARRVKPFPAPTKLTSASVDHRSAAKPSTYLRLYTVGRPIRRASGADGWLRISLFGTSSPWTDGWNSLWISRHAAYLRRDGQLVRIPASIAKRVRRAAPIPR